MMNTEVVVTFRCSYSTSQEEGSLRGPQIFTYTVRPYFLEVCELFCSEEDGDDLEELREIYKYDDLNMRYFALQQFLILDSAQFYYKGQSLDREFKYLHEFNGFRYGFNITEDLRLSQTKCEFQAVAHLKLDDLVSRCKKLGVTIEELTTLYDISFRVTDPSLRDQIRVMIGIPELMPLPPDSCEIKFGEVQRFTGYRTDSEITMFADDDESIDICDRETRQFISEEKIVMPEDMVVVEGGEFYMGNNVLPNSHKHAVHLSDYYISRYPVTFEQYDRYCKETGRAKPDAGVIVKPDQPVVNITYADAKAYCIWITKKTGIRTDLPTEAQWEFAARGGNLSKGFKFAGSNDYEEVGWSEGNPQSVGNKKPNELGLFDMSGNIYEWCRDVMNKEFYRHSPVKDPLCLKNDTGFKFTDFFRASTGPVTDDLMTAYERWKRRMRVEGMEEGGEKVLAANEEIKYQFSMSVRGGRRQVNSVYGDFYTIFGRYSFPFAEIHPKLGFRIVSYL